MRSVEFHPEAQNEFASAARYYEDQQDGLGLDFMLTIQRALVTILDDAPRSEETALLSEGAFADWSRPEEDALVID